MLPIMILLTNFFNFIGVPLQDYTNSLTNTHIFNGIETQLLLVIFFVQLF